MITLVNFADSKFRTKQKWNTFTGRYIGGFDQIFEYSPADLEDDLLLKNKQILQYEKGYGNYFWKSYIINKALERINNDDYLFYADSGSIFIRNIAPLILKMNNFNQSILVFHLPHIQKQWTKRDTFILMDCDTLEFYEKPQILAGYILIKKNPTSIEFIKEFHKYSSDYRIISDHPNVLGYDNYPGFIEHRHDQSIFSLLCKKYKLKSLPDPSDYGFLIKQYTNNQEYLFDQNIIDEIKDEKNVFLLSNRKVPPLIYLLKYYLKVFLSNLKLY